MSSESDIFTVITIIWPYGKEDMISIWWLSAVKYQDYNIEGRNKQLPQQEFHQKILVPINIAET